MNSIGLNNMDLFGMPTGGSHHDSSKTNGRGENLKSPPHPSCLTRFDAHTCKSCRLLLLSRAKSCSFGLAVATTSTRRSSRPNSQHLRQRNQLWELVRQRRADRHSCVRAGRDKMEKEHIKMAMLRQEQTFRQQVHELHRVYQVQKQLMTQTQITQHHQQRCGSSGKTEEEEDFNLELTLATGAGRTRQEKPSTSDSEATMSSSTSAESEQAQRFMPSSNVTNLRFQNESNRHDDHQVMQSAWRYQCLSLKMA